MTLSVHEKMRCLEAEPISFSLCPDSQQPMDCHHVSTIQQHADTDYNCFQWIYQGICSVISRIMKWLGCEEIDESTTEFHFEFNEWPLALIESGKPLSEKELTINSHSASGIYQIADLKHSPNAKKITIRCHHGTLGDQSIVLFERCPNATELALNVIRLSDKAWEAIAKLSQLTHFTMPMYISGDQFGKICHLPLTHMTICFPDHLTKDVIQQFDRLTSLTSLECHDLYKADPFFLDKIVQLPIKALNLVYNRQMMSEDLKKLLPKMQSVEELNLSETNTTDDVLAAIFHLPLKKLAVSNYYRSPERMTLESYKIIAQMKTLTHLTISCADDHAENNLAFIKEVLKSQTLQFLTIENWSSAVKNFFLANYPNQTTIFEKKLEIRLGNSEAGKKR